MLKELNEQIMEFEKKLLEEQMVLINLKKTLSIAKFEFKQTLDKKEYSNEEKRELKCLEESNIFLQTKNIEDYEYMLKIKEIELRYKLREFDILLKTELI